MSTATPTPTPTPTPTVTSTTTITAEPFANRPDPGHPEERVKGRIILQLNRLPRGELASGYGPEVPERIVEVLSPSDRWGQILSRIGEDLDAGVNAVLVLDDPSRAAQIFRSDAPPQRLSLDTIVTFPDILPGFEASVRSLLGGLD